MKKHGRQQRQLGALIRLYRTCTPEFTNWLRTLVNHRDIDIGREPHERSRELIALESRLPPEMVEWAKLNR